ncbi:MAG: hypothetical protein AAF621_01910 [Pseudomonadota bacterium]
MFHTIKAFLGKVSLFSVIATAYFLLNTQPIYAIDVAASAADIEPSHSAQSYDVNDRAAQRSQRMLPVRSSGDPVNYSPANGQRVYYARSMTSNNPNYKTRFSILHETPSPKRIAGERLYNLSDEAFRFSALGNKITLLDTTHFKLTGINSAKGRYGELTLHKGGELHIHGTSKRFRGQWDVDGTGMRAEKVTPTNLVSGTLPATLKTYRPDGTLYSQEDHTLIFKAMAMGPYNGYWTDGQDIGIWLWGMSKKKLSSGEFTYLGLDLGIITQPAPVDNTPTASIVPQEKAPAPMITNSVPAPVASFGGGGFPVGGFGGAVIPFVGGGGGGGGGTTTVIVRDFCDENPNDERCRPFCERFPDDKACRPFCEQFPDDKSCRPFCEQNPNDPECRPFCERFPDDEKCRPFCEQNPDDPECRPFCERYPNDEKCRPFCEQNPDDPECRPFCEQNPDDPECRPFCEKNPDHPDCHPTTCDPKVEDCDPTEVSEPWGLLAIMTAFGIFISGRRRRK